MESERQQKGKLGRRLVRIRFYDPTEFDTRFDHQTNPIECHAVGWVVGSNKEFLKLAWIFDDCKDHDYSGLTIPRGCLREIKEVKGN
jgi:hypothetical protein